ncbi:MAG TPA: hypothetical protein VGB18_08295, partial [Candidatus Thermoplasmatota archaeon]
GKVEAAARFVVAILARILVGALSGVVASLVMYALLFPLARGAPLPPEQFALAIFKTDSVAWRRFLGLEVQLLFGLFYGAVFGVAGATGFVPGESFAFLGILVGLAAFLVSFTGFRILGLAAGAVDWRAWAGHFLNHVVFGVTLGVLFLWAT